MSTEQTPYCNPCQSYHPVSQPCFNAATTPRRIAPEPETPPQSKAYQDAAAVEAKLGSITSAHSRTLELMNWKLAGRASVAALVDEADDLHLAICQAVYLMNQGDLHAGHDLLRQRLVDFADRKTPLSRSEIVRQQQGSASGEVTAIMISPATSGDENGATT